MECFVYIALCDRKTLYVGSSSKPTKREKGHKAKDTPFTSKFSDFEIVYTEQFNSRKEASKREFQLKKWSKAKKEALIKILNY